MDSNSVIWIVIAVLVGLLLIGVVLWAGRRQRDARRRAHAEELREQLRREDAELRHRESIAAETEAHARAIQAEADAKAAQAARLQNAAEGHRSAVESSREELEQRRRQAEKLAPVSGSGRPPEGRRDAHSSDRPSPGEHHSPDRSSPDRSSPEHWGDGAQSHR